MKNIDNTGNILHVDKVNYAPFAVLKQEDNFVITLDLYQNGQELDITGQTIELAAKRGDNVVVQQVEGFTLNKNKVTITLKTNVISVPGIVQCELNIKDNTGSFTTSNFSLRVNEKILGETSLNASDNIQALEKVKNEFIASSKALELDFSTNSANELQNFANSSTESLNRFITTSTAQLDNQKTDYESLKKIIIDPNQAANLQNQITETKSQSVENTNRIEELENLTPVWQEHTGTRTITVEDSFEGNVKDFVIKGQTLQNLTGLKGVSYAGNSTGNRTVSNSSVTVTLTSNGSYVLKYKPTISLKENTDYTVFFLADNDLDGLLNCSFASGNDFSISLTMGKLGFNKIKLNTGSKNIDSIAIGRHNSMSSGTTFTISDLILLEGDYTNNQLPFSSYFDSIASSAESEGNKIIIKSVGKNLIFEKKEGYGLSGASIWTYVKDLKGKCYIAKAPKGIYTGSSKNGNRNRLGFFKEYPISDKTKSLISVQGTITTQEDGYIVFYTDYENPTPATDVQLEAGTIASNYEPYIEDKKEILLPCPHREWNIYEGEGGRYIENSTEYIFPNDLTWTSIQAKDTTLLFQTYGGSVSKSFNNNNVICNNFKVDNTIWDKDSEGMYSTFNNNQTLHRIRILKSKLETQDEAGFKKWLQQNPTKIIYELATPVVHNIEKMRPASFDGTTHIIQENSICGDMNFKAKISLSAQNNRIKKVNEELKIENKDLRNDTSFIAGTLLSMLEAVALPNEEDLEKREMLNKLLEIKERVY